MKDFATNRRGKLTDDNLTTISGNEDKLVGARQERYGISRERAERPSGEWRRSAESAGKPLRRQVGH